jgi:thioredoxin
MDSNKNEATIIEVGESNFEPEVLRARQPVLVAFLAPWSQPCQTVETVLADVAAACAGAIKIVKVNADDNPHLGFWYEIQSIPTLLHFVGGNLRAKIVGNVGKEKILAKLQPISDSGGSKFSTPEK